MSRFSLSQRQSADGATSSAQYVGFFNGRKSKSFPAEDAAFYKVREAATHECSVYTDGIKCTSWAFWRVSMRGFCEGHRTEAWATQRSIIGKMERALLQDMKHTEF